MTQRNELLKQLQKFEELFDVTLGTWKKDSVELDFKEYTKPIFSRPYTVPKLHKEMFKNDVENLVLS